MNCELKGSPWESIRLFFRLRVVPRLSSRTVERAKRERAWKSPHLRKGDTRLGLAWGAFYARSRFARSTITEEKWGTTRLLPPPPTHNFPWNVFISLLQNRCYSSWRSKSSSPRCLHSKGRTIRKVMGVGGGGIFEAQEYFSLSNFLYEFFLGHSMNIS